MEPALSKEWLGNFKFYQAKEHGITPVQEEQGRGYKMLVHLGLKWRFISLVFDGSRANLSRSHSVGALHEKGRRV